MGEMVRAEIVNDKQARETQLAEVQALGKVVRKLASDIPDQASLASEAASTLTLSSALCRRRGKGLVCIGPPIE